MQNNDCGMDWKYIIRLNHHKVSQNVVEHTLKLKGSVTPRAFLSGDARGSQLQEKKRRGQ